MKNEKQTVFRFPFSVENKKRMKYLKNSNKKSVKHENGSQFVGRKGHSIFV